MRERCDFVFLLALYCSCEFAGAKISRFYKALVICTPWRKLTGNWGGFGGFGEGEVKFETRLGITLLLQNQRKSMLVLT